jgi:spore coat protein H
MQEHKRFLSSLKRLSLLLGVLLLAACSQEPTPVATDAAAVSTEEAEAAVDRSAQIVSTSEDIIGSDEWDEYSHSNSTDPDYEVVFPQDEVNPITITINPTNWELMQADMTDLYGEFGTREGGFGGRPDRDFQPPEDGALPEGFEPPADGELPEGFDPDQMPEGFNPGQGGPGGFGGGGMMGMSQNPMWVTADIEFDGQTWSNVGMRFKGNSSLAGAWGSGTMKLGFKLDFDEFENTYTEIENQRFYGFQQLTFSSNWNDESFLREKVSADIFRDAGIPAAQTSFYAVYVDYGEGPVYFGLYTAVEAVEDTVIETQFADDSGNLYKPEGNAATFAEGTFDEEGFDKETNQAEDDYSDVQALYDALNAETRTTDPEAWRADLEAVFDVDNFLHWLAVNTVIQNWDTYGRMSHNFYLYNDPATGRLTWIPWDGNLSLQDGMGGPGGGRGGMAEATDLDLESVGENWPLIRYLMDDPMYQEVYIAYVEDTINNVFIPTEMAERYTALHEMIAPYVAGVNGEIDNYTFLSSDEAFENALTDLIDHVQRRYEVAIEYLNSQAASQ